MDEARRVYMLSNGEVVGINDKVKVVTNHEGEFIGEVVDIAETYITISLLDESGELDTYYSELKDVRLIK